MEGRWSFVVIFQKACNTKFTSRYTVQATCFIDKLQNNFGIAPCDDFTTIEDNRESRTPLSAYEV